VELHESNEILDRDRAEHRRRHRRASCGERAARDFELLVRFFEACTSVTRRGRARGWIHGRRRFPFRKRPDGRPDATFTDASSDRATCSTIWLGDHFPGPGDVIHAWPVDSACAISR
jgi:hypothetical protein